MLELTDEALHFLRPDLGPGHLQRSDPAERALRWDEQGLFRRRPRFLTDHVGVELRVSWDGRLD